MSNRKPSTPFGKYLRTLRIARDETQVEMAAKLSISGAFLSCIELGDRDIPQTFYLAMLALRGAAEPICHRQAP